MMESEENIICTCDNCCENYGRETLNKAGQIIEKDYKLLNYICREFLAVGSEYKDVLNKICSFTPEELEYYKLMARIAEDDL